MTFDKFKVFINKNNLDNWIKENYDELMIICKKISRAEDVDDLFQICIEQFLTNKKTIEIPDEQKLYFFARIVRNNFNSTTSKYHNTHRKHTFQEINNIEIKEEEYKEPIISMDWVNAQIKNLKDNQWYYGRILELYIEEGCSLTKLSKRTSIPINSVSRDINKVKKILRAKREDDLKNQ